MAKTKTKPEHQLTAFVALVASLVYVFYVAQWLTSYAAENSLGNVWNILPGKYALLVAVVFGSWSWVKAGRMKLLTTLALGMAFAASYIWLYLAVFTKVA